MPHTSIVSREDSRDCRYQSSLARDMARLLVFQEEMNVPQRLEDAQDR